MAALIVDGNKTIACCGSKVVTYDSWGGPSCEHSSVLQPFFTTATASEENEECKVNSESAVEKQPPVKNGGSAAAAASKLRREKAVACMGRSVCGQYMAVCGQNKVLKVFHNNQLVSSTLLARKASKLVFTADASHVVLADKNGDVYKIKTTQQEIEVEDTKEVKEVTKDQLVLGHLSMLLDLQLTPSNRYIITADRDEKIRVSHFPHGYNINNYCLGHTDFVTSISVISEDLLVSGSGDGTVRVWKFLDGKELALREVHKDVDVKLDRSAMLDKSGIEKVKQDIGDLDIERKRNEPSDQPAVIKTKPLNNQRQFLAQVEGVDGLLLYDFNPSNNNITKQQLIELKPQQNAQHTLMDFDLDTTSNRLTCLVLSTVDADTYKNGKEDKGNSKMDDSNSSVQQKTLLLQRFHFNNVADAGGRYDCNGDEMTASELTDEADSVAEEWVGELSSLHKRWFDNMTEYLARKQQRIDKQQKKAQEAASDTATASDVTSATVCSADADIPTKKAKMDIIT